MKAQEEGDKYSRRKGQEHGPAQVTQRTAGTQTEVATRTKVSRGVTVAVTQEEVTQEVVTLAGRWGV